MSGELTNTNLNFTGSCNITAATNITLRNSSGITYTWPTATPTTGQILNTTSTGTMAWVTMTGTPSGPVGAIQFQNNPTGTFSGSSNLLYDTSVSLKPRLLLHGFLLV